jgi:phosphate transport system substrate-binding protein
MNRILILAAISLGLVPAALAQKIIIKGSNTFGEELGPALVEAYRARHPAVEFELESKGTTSGLGALLDGACDIATASRMATEDERRAARSRNIRLKVHTVGYYGVAVIVHETNPLGGLSSQQVRDLFTGRIKNWKDVGGENRPVVLCIRAPESGTHLGFRELAMENKPYPESAQTFTTYQDLARYVAEHPDAIGYSEGQAWSGLAVKRLHINGFPLNEVSVNEGLYPYARLIRFYTRADRESAPARAFIRFTQSKSGQDLLESRGYIPRKRHSLGTFPGPGF